MGIGRCGGKVKLIEDARDEELATREHKEAQRKKKEGGILQRAAVGWL